MNMMTNEEHQTDCRIDLDSIPSEPCTLDAKTCRYFIGDIAPFIELPSPWGNSSENLLKCLDQKREIDLDSVPWRPITEKDWQIFLDMKLSEKGYKQ